MNTTGPGNSGKSSHMDEDLARKYASVKRERDEARQSITRLTEERDAARRQCAQYTNELNTARNREEALQGHIWQLEETVKNLQGGAFVAAIAGAGVTAALLMRNR
jgi:chromosome segregation ATPase